MAQKYREVLFTPAVLEAQDRYYGRARPAAPADGPDPLGPDERAFIAERDSFYLATVTENGWPYVQHRGGPPGFLHVLGPSKLGFADYGGNRQLITAGSLSVDDRVSLFLMDYPNRARLKILGHARVEDARANPELAAQLAGPTPEAPVERVIQIDVVSFDWNCSKHITPRFSADQIAPVVDSLRRRIAKLEMELKAISENHDATKD